MKARNFSFTSDDGDMNIYVDFEKQKVTFSTEKHCIEISIDDLDELNTRIQDEYENL